MPKSSCLLLPHLHILIYLFTCLSAYRYCIFFLCKCRWCVCLCIWKLCKCQWADCAFCDVQANLICDICLDNFLYKNFELTSTVSVQVFLHIPPSQHIHMYIQFAQDFPLRVWAWLPQETSDYMIQLNSTCIYVKLFALRRQLESKRTRSGQKADRWAVN